MKTTIKLLSVLMVLSFYACKKKDDATPVLKCKLATIDRGNLNKHIYTYDATGKITTMTREFVGDGKGKVSKYVYTLTYDAAGLIISSANTLDGLADSKETYTYTNGKISRTDFVYASGIIGYNAIKYNSNGQILDFTYQGSGNTDDDSKQYFEYYANGIMVKRGYSDMSGKIKFFEVVTKPVGLVKSPESLLPNNGLPYDLLTGFSYSLAEGGVGTTTEVFAMDNMGVFGATGDTGKVTAIKTNAKGYLTETTFVDNTNKIEVGKFEMIDCN